MTKGIISSTKASLDVINAKIHDYMKANISNYKADRWGEIHKHPIESKWILIINDDSRNPLKRLTHVEKLKNKTFNVNEWFPMNER
jgi:hypothetical protein